MPLEKDKTIAEELRYLTYQNIAAFDENVTDGESLAYYENSQIDNAIVYGNTLSGRVGNYFEKYDVKLVLNDREISSSCSCGNDRKICRHAIALLYAWIHDAADFVNIAEVLKIIKTFDKARLVEIVGNMLQNQPQLADVFLAKKKPNWNEIELNPTLE